MSAGFSLAWATICFLIYKVFCKKYENKLIQAKEEEEKRIQNENDKNDNHSINTTLSDFELRQRFPHVNQIAEQTRF